MFSSRTIKIRQIRVNLKNRRAFLNHPAVTIDFLSKTARALQKKISGAIIGFMWPKITYWLPRLIVFGFAASMVIPAPKFIASMENAEFLVWLLRLIWVLAFPAGFFVVLIFTNLIKDKEAPVDHTKKKG